jgi:hypothetical protein
MSVIPARIHFAIETFYNEISKTNKEYKNNDITNKHITPRIKSNYALFSETFSASKAISSFQAFFNF